MGKISNIQQLALTNTYFRQVLDTGKHSQVVIMHIPAGSEIGEETHRDNDQILYLVAGEGTAYLDDEASPYEAGDVVLVPAGTKHNFVASAEQSLKIVTVYSPAHHPEGTIHKTRAEADAAG